jgi:hypothetical protein
MDKLCVIDPSEIIHKTVKPTMINQVISEILVYECRVATIEIMQATRTTKKIMESAIPVSNPRCLPK